MKWERMGSSASVLSVMISVFLSGSVLGCDYVLMTYYVKEEVVKEVLNYDDLPHEYDHEHTYINARNEEGADWEAVHILEREVVAADGAGHT